MKATVTAHRDFTIAAIDERIYSAFLEHLGRAVYTGIHEPDHPTADANGMRGDVAELVRELDIPFVRYPGGNFVSAYNWEDGIGPVEQRPVRLDLAWHTSESNRVGIHEFMAWCDTVNTRPMLAINLGSRGLDQARNFVEYVNGPLGSYWGDLRKKNGRAEPWNCRLWCLGNEMDGPWQIGHKTAEEYGRLANETAKALRAFDKGLELVVCGSSNSDMKTYPEWERIVLEHTYEAVDHISLHMYFANRDGDTQTYLSLNHKLDRYIATVAAAIRLVKANKRSKRDVHISFDEWNVWYHSNAEDRAVLEGNAGWPHAPRLLEDIYIFEDVLQVGCILNTFIRRSDVVKIACIAQLVNVIAPIMTEPGGPAWRQTIYYPYYFASRHGRGTALNLSVSCPGYDSIHDDNVPWLDIAGVHDEAARTLTFFAINRHAAESLQTEIALQGFGAARVTEHKVMTHENLRARNTLADPDAVVPRDGAGARVADGLLTVTLPPHSWQMIRVTLA
ncbi:Alpha-L-arabinofuranosidase [Rubellimicrobium thermophilum DSM 16684]|uniref:non-reducing end alpha-L-arabinofuranosidase n=1 Tax=Rubellimicrobium thermophilum DSM 16684 TaxID=1123069 RepID=S9R6Z5_9RHOB|nr:alpha-N-arabinofuranosidase [Rubellimicrobium thermophilum]EPX87763.1 Alpha-L-arabinofuranosidase [Rubellimicrobium thermophilum DSM 16684]